jgi:hypothetical protein
MFLPKITKPSMLKTTKNYKAIHVKNNTSAEHAIWAITRNSSEFNDGKVVI